MTRLRTTARAAGSRLAGPASAHRNGQHWSPLPIKAALAGRGALSGVQANLYQLPDSDFHVVAVPGFSFLPADYNFVTGRGSPRANLIVGNLLTPPVMSTTATRNWSDPTMAGPVSPAAGNTLVLSGRITGDNLAITFLSATTFQVTLNGVSTSYTTTQYNNVVFNGDGGSDQATLNAGTTQSTFTISPGNTQWTGPNYVVKILNVNTIHVSASASSTASLDDPTGGAAFTGGPTASSLVGSGFSFFTSGLGKTVAYNTSRGVDRATFNDTAGNASFTCSPNQYAYLSGSGYVTEAIGFANVSATHTGATPSTAWIYDSPANDTFTGSASVSSLVGPGFSTTATGFATVYAYATSGGWNTANLTAAGGTNLLTAKGNTATLTTPTSTIYVIGYQQVNATASGSDDRRQIAYPTFSLASHGVWQTVS